MGKLVNWVWISRIGLNFSLRRVSYAFWVSVLFLEVLVFFWGCWEGVMRFVYKKFGVEFGYCRVYLVNVFVCGSFSIWLRDR